MGTFEILVSVLGTAAPLFAAGTCLVKLLRSVKKWKEERKQRLWSEFAKAAVKDAEDLRGNPNGELTGSLKKEIAMSKVEVLCSKSRVPFERDKVSEIIENIIDLTKKVNTKQHETLISSTIKDPIKIVNETVADKRSKMSGKIVLTSLIK